MKNKIFLIKSMKIYNKKTQYSFFIVVCRKYSSRKTRCSFSHFVFRKFLIFIHNYEWLQFFTKKIGKTTNS